VHQPPSTSAASLHRCCLPTSLLRPSIPVLSPDSCGLPPLLLSRLFTAALCHRFWPSLPGLRPSQLLPISATSAVAPLTGTAFPPSVLPPPSTRAAPPAPLVLPTPTGRRSHSGDHKHGMVWQVHLGQEREGGGSPNQRGGKRRRSCMADMHGAAASMAHPCQLPSPTESTDAYRVK